MEQNFTPQKSTRQAAQSYGNQGPTEDFATKSLVPPPLKIDALSPSITNGHRGGPSSSISDTQFADEETNNTTPPNPNNKKEIIPFKLKKDVPSNQTENTFRNQRSQNSLDAIHPNQFKPFQLINDNRPLKNSSSSKQFKPYLL